MIMKRKMSVTIKLMSVLCAASFFMSGCSLFDEIGNYFKLPFDTSDLRTSSNYSDSSDCSGSSDLSDSSDLSGSSDRSDSLDPSGTSDVSDSYVASSNPIRSTKGTGIYEVANVMKITYRDVRNNISMPYNLILPDDFDPSQKWPVILYLHGAKDMGNDNDAPLHLMLEYMYTVFGDYMQRAIVVCPQAEEYWTMNDNDMNKRGTEANLKTVMKIMDYVVGHYSVDKNRVYVMGVLMGGTATWDLLAEYPNYFAAGVPISGKGDVSKAAELLNIPIRAYHCNYDLIVPVTGTYNIYNEIKRLGGRKIKFIIPQGRAEASEYVKCDKDFYDWLFDQRR